MMWPLFAKLLGAVCVTLCGAAWGLGRAKSILMQVRLLEEMLRFLQCVESELEFRAQETPLLLHSAQKKARLRTLPLSLEGLPAGPGFPGQLAQRLEALRADAGMRRGTVAAGEECRELRYAQAQLQRLLEESRKDAQNRQKLFIVLGAGVGACVALLFL